MKKLDRSIGLTSVIAISLSAMLGSGIFVLPGLAAEKTGPSIALAYLLAGFCVLPAALCKGELATAMPSSGGTYVYLFRAFGPLAGTVAGLGLWVSLLLKSSFALVGFSAYLKALAPNVPIVPTGLALLVAVTALNVGGIGKLSKVQIAVAATSVGGLAVLMVAGVSSFQPAHFTPLFSKGTSGFVAATAFVFVSYAGVTKIAALAGEVKDPHRNIPRGIVMTLAIAASLYGLVTFGLAAIVPLDQLRGNLRPIFTLADIIGGRPLGIGAAILSVVTMTSMAAAGLLASSRFPFAMARDGLVPGVLGHVSERTKAPIAAIFATAVVMGASIVLLDVMKIAKLASAFTILMYMAENLAVIVLREGRVAWYRPTYRSPLYPTLHIFGIVSGLVLVILLGLLPSVGALVISALGAGLYFGYARSRTAHRGVVGKIGRRDDLMPSTASRAPEAPSEIVETSVGEAQVVVALFGSERSPEMLVDVGAALANDGRIAATHFTEVDEDLDFEDDTNDLIAASLERRIGAMAEETELAIDFDAVASHDMVRTVHGITDRAHCEWLVMQWQGRPRSALTSLSPIGWLINNLPANLATFKDEGVRYVRRLLVLPAPGPHDALVVRTADHLAARYKAEVTLARFVPDDASEATVESEQEYLAQLGRLCEGDAHEELVRGTNVVKAIVASSGRFDLIVMASPQLTWKNLVLTSTEDRITAGAACSVLRLRTPRGGTHVAYPRRAESPSIMKLRLADLLGADTAQAGIEVKQKAALMSFLAEHFASRAEGLSAKTILAALQQREAEQNTGVGEGIALPHGTVEGLPHALAAVFTLAKPIGYDAIDGEPVDVVFATISPPAAREAHLQLLSDIAALAIKTDLLGRLRAADDSEAILAAVHESTEDMPG